MDRRLAFALVLSFLVLMVFQLWLAPKRAPVRPTGSADSMQTAGSEPSPAPFAGAPAATGDTRGPSALAPLDSLVALAAPPETLTVTTPRVEAAFVTQGALLSRWTLADYHTPAGKPVQLVNGAGELGIVLDTEAGAFPLDRVPFAVRQEHGTEGQSLIFTADLPGGIRVVKTYTVPEDGYLLAMRVEVRGATGAGGYRVTWEHGIPPAEADPRELKMGMASLVMAGKDVTTLRPGSFRREHEKEITGNIRWAGTQNKYFFAGVVPPEGVSSRVVATGRGGGDLRTGVELVMPLPNGEATHDFRVYLGPMDYRRLQSLGLELEHAVNLGWKVIRPLSHLLLMLMGWMYRFLPNYGVVIILISAGAKFLFYPLTKSSVRSMREMQILQPQVEAIRAKHKGDQQRTQREMMALYKEHKINPMGGCLPVIVQMPVFIALYAVLANAIELRQADFVGWIHDLSTPDTITHVRGFPIHVLPFLMFATTILQQKFTPMTDPRQKVMGYMMPFVMLFIFYSFPAGLNLYWTVNNILTVAQNWQIHREHPVQEKANEPDPSGKSGPARILRLFRRDD